MKKILFIANYRKNVGGIAVQMDILQDYLTADGYFVDVFSTKGNPFHRIWLFFVLLTKARAYDVLHIHGCSNWGMLPVVYGVLAGRMWGKRVIVTYHGGGAEEYLARYERFARRWLNRADEVIVLSGFLKEVFDKHGIRNRVIPNVLKWQIEKPSIRTAVRPNFISVRSLEPLYNIPCIIKAFAVVKEILPEAKLTIMGKGSLREHLEALVAELHLTDVTFTGLVPNTEVPRYLAESDIFLSATAADNMPVSILEAYRSGLLVISSNVGGVPYILEDGDTGLLFVYDNYRQLAERMLWAIRNEDQSLEMIHNALIAVDNYSWNHVGPLLKRIYE